MPVERDSRPSFVQFIGYCLGVGTILIAVTIGAGVFQGAASQWLRKAMPYVHRMSALFLVGAESYLAYYWLFVAGLEAASEKAPFRGILDIGSSAMVPIR